MAFEKDKISRKAFADPHSEILNKLLSMKVLKTRQLPPRVRQTIEERETDVLLVVYAEEQKEFVLHLEFQSSNDNKMIIRMAIYDYMLHEEQGLDVMGMVIYTGSAQLTMKNKISFFNTNYSCPIIDIRDLDPQLFINSDNPRQVIYALLAGPDNQDKLIIIQKILSKLQWMLSGSEIELKECITELEFLSLARSLDIQKLIKKEVTNMPIPSNVRNSIFWKEEFDQAEEDAKKQERMESAELMIKDGMPLFKVNKYTRLGVRSLKEVLQRIKSSEKS